MFVSRKTALSSVVVIKVFSPQRETFGPRSQIVDWKLQRLRFPGGQRSVDDHSHVSDSTPPSDTAFFAIRTRRRNSNAAALPPLKSSEKRPPGYAHCFSKIRFCSGSVNSVG